MLEFSPICIYLVISLLVSLILLGLLFLRSHFQISFSRYILRIYLVFLLFGIFYCIHLVVEIAFFQTLLYKGTLSLLCRALSFALCKLGLAGGLALVIGFWARVLIPLLVSLVFLWFGIPVIAYCADGDEQTNSPEAGIGASSSIESVPPEEPSALEERIEDLIGSNLERRKAALGDGQEVSEVRQAVEGYFDVTSQREQFGLIQQMEKELTPTRNEQPPVTTFSLNEVKEYESHAQDGRGGGRPGDCSLQEKDKAHESKHH
uniref:NADH-ubiquinone oxidoreductase chain 6 n=1 Tax=Rhizophora mucronata TaxID=61149 RepID=A0A2P2MU68_RHIMU